MPLEEQVDVKQSSLDRTLTVRREVANVLPLVDELVGRVHIRIVDADIRRELASGKPVQDLLVSGVKDTGRGVYSFRRGLIVDPSTPRNPYRDPS